MALSELFIIAIGLSMDAFAVSVCIGLPMRRISPVGMLITGLYFGAFQGAMPLAGYYIGSWFSTEIVAFDHWIAFFLLGIIGGKMLKESFDKNEPEAMSNLSMGPKRMLPLALATSIDALAVGVSFAFLNVQIIPAVSFIGVVTFLLSMLGVGIGHAFGLKFKSKAELIGGLILILMGFKILLEHLGVIAF